LPSTKAIRWLASV